MSYLLSGNYCFTDLLPYLFSNLGQIRVNMHKKETCFTTKYVSMYPD